MKLMSRAAGLNMCEFLSSSSSIAPTFTSSHKVKNYVGMLERLSNSGEFGTIFLLSPACKSSASE